MLSISVCPGMRRIHSNVGKSSVHYSVAAVALLPMCPCPVAPSARSSFISISVSNSVMHAREQRSSHHPTHSAPLHTTTRGEEDRVTAALPPHLPGSPSAPPDSMFAIHRRCKEEREGEDGRGEREPPINSHVYLDLKVGVFRQTRPTYHPLGRPRCQPALD